QSRRALDIAVRINDWLAYVHRFDARDLVGPLADQRRDPSEASCPRGWRSIAPMACVIGSPGRVDCSVDIFLLREGNGGELLPRRRVHAFERPPRERRYLLPSNEVEGCERLLARQASSSGVLKRTKSTCP